MPASGEAARNRRVPGVVTREGAEVEHHPRHGPIEVEVPDREFPARNWTSMTAVGVLVTDVYMRIY